MISVRITMMIINIANSIYQVHLILILIDDLYLRNQYYFLMLLIFPNSNIRNSNYIIIIVTFRIRTSDLLSAFVVAIFPSNLKTSFCNASHLLLKRFPSFSKSLI